MDPLLANNQVLAKTACMCCMFMYCYLSFHDSLASAVLLALATVSLTLLGCMLQCTSRLPNLQ